MSQHRGIVVVVLVVACEKQRPHSPSTSIMSLLKEAVWAILFLPPMELVCERYAIRHRPGVTKDTLRQARLNSRGSVISKVFVCLVAVKTYYGEDVNKM